MDFLRFSGSFRRSVAVLRLALMICGACSLGGCFGLPQDPSYRGPTLRPPEVEAYYKTAEPYGAYSEEVLRSNRSYTLKKITIQTYAGPVSIDYYQRPEKSDSLVLVFPVLGGKPVVESYFARHFAAHGFDSAIVNRSNDFKNPDNIDRLEEILHHSVIRDRLAMDFFERVYQKKRFGSFGISRGAINAAITAGVDSRLANNVLVLGGSDMPKMFERSNQGRIKKFITSVVAKKNITREQFFAGLERDIKTDPKNFARFIDSRNTLMILGLFDRTVPIKYGRLLREQIGNPKTIYLMADHFLGILYSRVIQGQFMPEGREGVLPVPFNYIESEALAFYREKFETGEKTLGLVPFRLLRIPMDLLGRVADAIF